MFIYQTYNQSQTFVPNENASVSVTKSQMQLPKGFTANDITYKEDGKGAMKIGTFIKIENTGTVELACRDNHRDFTFNGITDEYNREGKTVVAQVAAAFSRAWTTPLGQTAENGKDVKYSMTQDNGQPVDWTGVVAINKDGKIQMYNLNDIVGKDAFFNSLKEDGCSYFLQKRVLWNGEETKKFNDTGGNQLRFIVKMQDGTCGLVDFDKSTTIDQAALLLKKMGVQQAVYLDVGPAVGTGFIYQQNGVPKPIGERTPSESSYTTKLLLISK